MCLLSTVALAAKPVGLPERAFPMARCMRWGCVGIPGAPGGGGGHGAHRLMVGICAARLRAHCGEKFGCLLVPQLARRQNGHKHGMEGLYER